MNNLTPESVRNLRSQIDAALLPILNANGLASLTAGNCSYDPKNGTFHFKLAGAVVGGADNEEASRYQRQAKSLNLPPLNTRLILVGRTGGKESFVVVGMKSRGKSVLIKKTTTGVTMRANVSIIQRAWAEQAPK